MANEWANFDQSIKSMHDDKRINQAILYEKLLCFISLELATRFSFAMPILYSVASADESYKMLATETIRNTVIEEITNEPEALKLFKSLYTDNKDYFDSISEFAAGIQVPNSDISKAYCKYNYLDDASVVTLWGQFVRIFVDKMTSYLFSVLGSLSTQAKKYDPIQQIIDGMANKTAILEPVSTSHSKRQKYFQSDEIYKFIALMSQTKDANGTFNPFVAQEYIYVEFMDGYKDLPTTTAHEGYIYKNQFAEFTTFLLKTLDSLDSKLTLDKVFKKFTYGIRINQIDFSRDTKNEYNNNFIVDGDKIRDYNKLKSYFMFSKFTADEAYKQEFNKLPPLYYADEENLPPFHDVEVYYTVYPIDELELLSHVPTTSKSSTDEKEVPFTVSQMIDYLRGNLSNYESIQDQILRFRLLNNKPPASVEELSGIDATLKQKIAAISTNEYKKFGAVLNYCFPISYLSSIYSKLLANDLVTYAYNFSKNIAKTDVYANNKGVLK